MLLYSLIVLWFAEVGHRQYRPSNRPWYPHKPHASFADMRATLKRLSVREQFCKPASSAGAVEKTSAPSTPPLQATA